MRTSPDARIADLRARGRWGDSTIDSLFRAAVRAHPSKLALVDAPNRSTFAWGDAERLTFADVDLRVGRAAVDLYSTGVRQGDVVVVQLPNVVDTVVVYLALARLGAIVSPIPIQYGPDELRRVAATLDARAYLVADRSLRVSVDEMRASVPGGCVVIACGAPGADGVPTLFGAPLPSPATEQAQSYLRSLTVSADDIYTITWTSGTTGTGKGVPRSHNMWRASSAPSRESVGLDHDDVMLNPFPFSAAGSIGGFFLNWLILANTLVLHHPFDQAAFLAQVEAEAVTYTIAPPTVLTRLCQSPEAGDRERLRSLRVVGSGGAAIPTWVIGDFESRFGPTIVNMFGSSEGLTLISNQVDVPSASDRAVLFPRFGVDGLEWSVPSASWMQTRLADPETGETIVERGVPGELLVRGPAVFDGYYGTGAGPDPVFTDDGYFRTGDLFELAGSPGLPEFYRFVGRSKEIIVRGGMKISPAELDEILTRHPSISDCAVIGLPDEELEERVCAVVVPREGEVVELADVVQFMRADGVAVFKLPERLVTVDELPRNVNGKVVRSELRAFVLGLF